MGKSFSPAAILAAGLLVASCDDSNGPTRAAFASLAGEWHLYECGVTQLAAPHATAQCLVDATLVVDSTGDFTVHYGSLPGEDPPPVLPGHFHLKAGTTRAAFGLDWEVGFVAGRDMRWAAEGTYTFPASAGEEPATIVQLWERIPTVPVPAVR